MAAMAGSDRLVNSGPTGMERRRCSRAFGSPAAAPEKRPDDLPGSSEESPSAIDPLLPVGGFSFDMRAFLNYKYNVLRGEYELQAADGRI
jgi:hypothetical protein